MKERTLKRMSFLTALAAMSLPGLLMAGLESGVELKTSSTDEPEPRQPEISVVYGDFGLDSGSNTALMQEDLGNGGGNSGGIERLYWENDASNDWRVYLESRYLRNPDELFVNFEMHNGYNAFFDVQFSRWTEYDMAGELFDMPSQTLPLLSAEAFEEEISKLKLSLKLMPTDVTQLKMEYGYFERKGTSLSTVYGDDYAYVLGGKASRGIIPALTDGVERVHTADVSFIHQEEETRAGLRVHYQNRQVDRQQVVERSANRASANRFTTQETKSDDDLFAFSGFNRAQINDSLVGSMGFAFTRMDGSVNGSRVFGANPEAEYDIDFAATQLYDRGFLDLENSRKLKQWIFNANMVYTPSEDYRWATGIRLEHLSTDSFSSYLDTHSTVDYVDLEFQDQEGLMTASMEKSALDVSGFIEGRYTGFNHALVYSRVEASSQGGDLDEDWNRQEILPNEDVSISLLDRATDFERQRAFWEVGANFFPINKLRFSVEGYIKYNDNSYDWGGVSLPSDDFTLYPGYIRNQEFLTRDFNARIHCRMIPNLSSVTRIDVQRTTIEGDNGITTQIESSNRERFVFNQSLVWTPHQRFYISGSFTKVEDLTETDAVQLESGFEGIIVNLPNDYWQTDLNLYYVLTKLMDVQVSYQYLKLDQFMATSPNTVAYGMDLEQHHGMVQLLFHFSPRLSGNIAYHIYDRDEPSANELKDYTVNLVNAGLQLVF